MLRRAEIAVVAIAIAVTIALAVSDPGSDRQKAERHDVETVRRAAEDLAYPTVADAWRQARLGTGAALSAIVEGIDVRYLSTHQTGDAIFLTFESRSGACIDLVSRPQANTVEPRACCRASRPPAGLQAVLCKILHVVQYFAHRAVYCTLEVMTGGRGNAASVGRADA